MRFSVFGSGAAVLDSRLAKFLPSFIREFQMSLVVDADGQPLCGTMSASAHSLTGFFTLCWKSGHGEGGV